MFFFSDMNSPLKSSVQRSAFSVQRSAVTGHWSLVTGHWSLVTGLSLTGEVFTTDGVKMVCFLLRNKSFMDRLELWRQHAKGLKYPWVEMFRLGSSVPFCYDPDRRAVIKRRFVGPFAP
jgi:hypothetical protein